MGGNVWGKKVYFCLLLLFIIQSPFFSGGGVISYSRRCPQFPLKNVNSTSILINGKPEMVSF